MSALAKTPASMTVAEFYAFAEAAPGRWQLVDGKAIAMAPANRTHGAVQAELSRLIANALVETGGPCSVVVAPGVIPHVRSHANVRVPDLAVVCGDYETEQRALTEPVALIEILSPSNASKLANVWTYTTIPSVKGKSCLSHRVDRRRSPAPPAGRRLAEGAGTDRDRRVQPRQHRRQLSCGRRLSHDPARVRSVLSEWTLRRARRLNPSSPGRAPAGRPREHRRADWPTAERL